MDGAAVRRVAAWLVQNLRGVQSQAGRECRAIPEKNAKIYVEGSLRSRKRQDKEGHDRYTTEINVNDMQMLDGKGGGSSGGDDYGSFSGYGGGASSGTTGTGGTAGWRWRI